MEPKRAESVVSDRPQPSPPPSTQPAKVSSAEAVEIEIQQPEADADRQPDRAPDTQPKIQELRWLQSALMAWGDRHRRDFPWRHTRDPYAMLVAECLLQKTQAERVEPAYRMLLERFPTLESLADADLVDIEQAIAHLGLKERASRLQRAARTLVLNYGGRIPDSEPDLLALPGIGPYTARAILACAFQKRAPVFDSNVARIVGRYFGLPACRLPQRNRQYLTLTEAIAPHRDLCSWNLTLLDLGATVCTSRQPKCGICPLVKRCLTGRQTTARTKDTVDSPSRKWTRGQSRP